MTKPKTKPSQTPATQALPGLTGEAAGGHGPTEATRGGARRMTDADLFPSPDVWATMKEQAKVLIEANMAPEKLDSEAKVLVVMMRGRELGIPPMQACGSIFVNDDGLPSMTAELMRSRVYASGVGTIVILEYSDERGLVRGVRYGAGNRPDQTQEFSFTRADAEKTGNRFTRGLPRHTLIARATSDCARLMFSDVLAGVVYTPEDLDTEDRRRGSTPASPPPPPPTVAREAAQEPATPPPAAQVAPPPSPPPAAAAQAAPSASAGKGKGKTKPVGESAPKAPAAAAPSSPPPPPASGVPDSGVPGRPWVHLITIPTGNGPQSIWTHGITTETLLAIGDASRGNESLVEQGRRWLTSRGAPRLVYLTDAEGLEILQFLKDTQAAGDHAIEPGRMGWDDARASLETVIERFQLTPIKDKILAEACRRHDVPGLEAIPAEALYAFVRELQEQGEPDNGAGLRLALERLSHEVP